MSTYSTDQGLPEEPDEYRTSVSVSSSPVDVRVRLDMSIVTDMDQEYFMAPDYARKLAAALVRAAERAQGVRRITDGTVRGRCPACGHEVLILGEGGYVTCSLMGCPDPEAATKLLEGGS